MQTCPTPEEDGLEIGGEGYYVDIDVECGGGSFELGGRIWVTDDPEVAGWADPGERHEGGTFTLDAEDHGTFVGDAAGTLVAEFRTLGPAGSRTSPAPRSPASSQRLLVDFVRHLNEIDHRRRALGCR